jgi:hypothetical protein
VEYLLIGGVIGACLGVSLGVLAPAIFAASDEAKAPTPAACAYPRGECLIAQRTGNAF